MNAWQRTVEEQDAEIARAKTEMRERCAQVAENFNAAGKPIAAAIRALKDQ